MSVTIKLDVQSAGAEVAKLVASATTAGELILTQDGQPVARVVPIPNSANEVNQPKPKRVFGRAKGYLTVPDDFDEPLEDMKPYMEGPE